MAAPIVIRQDVEDRKISNLDPGLALNIPLMRLMRTVNRKTLSEIVVREFKSCKYIQDHNATIPLHQDLYKFLKETINKQGKKDQTEFNKKNKEKPKTTEEKLSWQIFNLDDNKEDLQKITVKNMMDADAEKCKALKNFDSVVLLNIIINAVLKYNLSDTANKAINKVKDTRNEIYHANYNFVIDDFNRNIGILEKALQEIYNHFGFSINDLDNEIMECKREATDPDISLHLKIFRELQNEIHPKYKSPANFVCPIIKDPSDGTESYLEEFLKDLDGKPILLCGKRGAGKTSIIQNQAYQLVKKLTDDQQQGDATQFSLVFLFENNDHGQLNKENFSNRVKESIENLAPKTHERYGTDIVKLVMKIYVKKTIYLASWPLQEIVPPFEELSNGTWVFTYHGYPGSSVDWNVLIAESLSDKQVFELLESLNKKKSKEYIDRLHESYRNCKYKNTLSTPDMVKIFNEVHLEVGCGTEFELIVKYVKKKMYEKNLGCDVINAVGKLSFFGIKDNKTQFHNNDDEVKYIGECGRSAFFNKNGKNVELIPEALMDFFASIYVIENPIKACRIWLKNTTIFKRVFKFVCFFWFRDFDHDWKETVEKNSKEFYLLKIEDFLCTFLSVKKDRMNVDISEVEETEMQVDISEVEEREMLMSGNPVKNPFSKWGFLVHIDEACEGIPEVLKMLAHLLSHIKCWVFKCNEWDDSKSKRIRYILDKVTIHQRSPVLIEIECGLSCSMLINIWNMLKNTKSLQNAVRVKISIMHEKKEGKCQILDDANLEKLPKIIVNTYEPLYITELNIPVICPRIPDFKFSTCECFQKLEYLEAIVYDVNSLREVLVCGNLSNLKSIKIYVNLKPSEQRIDRHPQLQIPNPRNKNVSLTVVYFKEIQRLLNAFTCRHRLLSLSIHGLTVDKDFKIDMSAFKNMESLYLHCDKNFVALNKNLDSARILSTNLTLPEKLERLLLSGVQFYNDTNIHLFTMFFADYNIQRLMILDSNLALDGARTVLNDHVSHEIDRDLYSVPSKKIRFSKEVRLVKQEKKPKGKEIIITSNTKLDDICSSNPCLCEIQCTDMLIPLIKGAYCSSIISFAFSNVNVVLHKNLCNDLRVHCPFFKIKDDQIYDIYQKQQMEISPNSPISLLFQSFIPTQYLYIENTNLSYDGLKILVKILKKNKSRVCQGNVVEPFSLTVTSDYLHTSDPLGFDSEVCNSQIIKFFKEESCLQMLNFWCTCDDRCHKFKKTHNGVIFLNDIAV